MNTKNTIFSFKENELSNKKMSVILGGKPIDPPPPIVVIDTTQQTAQSTGNGGGVGNDHTSHDPITVASLANPRP